MLEWLKTILGDTYTEEIDKQVSEAIGKSFVSKADFNAKNEAYKNLEGQISERDKQLEELKKVDASGLQAEISRLQGENKAAKDSYEQQMSAMRFDFALNTALGKAKAKNNKALKALLDTESLKMDGDNILGLDAQLEKLRTEADYLFESDKQAPAFAAPTPGIPPTNKSTNEMTYSELNAFMAANPGAQI